MSDAETLEQALERAHEGNGETFWGGMSIHLATHLDVRNFGYEEDTRGRYGPWWCAITCAYAFDSFTRHAVYARADTPLEAVQVAIGEMLLSESHPETWKFRPRSALAAIDGAAAPAPADSEA